MAVKIIGLIFRAEIPVKVGYAGYLGSFKVEDHGFTGKFPDEMVQQEMVGRRQSSGRQDGGLQQVHPVFLPEE